jgi:ferredoxin
MAAPVTAATASPSTTGGQMLCTGADAVRRAEEQLCGAGVVDSIARAQGAAAAGGRAAVLEEDEHAATSPGQGAWVVHRRRRAGSQAAGGYAFTLLAGDPQQAADHCLVAHHLATRIGMPGACDLDPEAADAFAAVDLPPAGVDLPDVALDRPATEILAAADEAFAAAARLTGRAAAAVERHGADDTPHVVVAAGSAVARAREAADLLAADGVDCAVVALALLHPLPADALQRAIGAASVVAVLDPHGRVAGQADLAALVRSALWDGSDGVSVQALVQLPRSAKDLADTLRHSFGVDGSTPAAPTSDAASRRLRVLPAGSWADDAVLTALAPVVSAGTSLRRPADGEWLLGTSSDDSQEADLLLAAHASLVDTDAIEGLRHGGVLFVPGETPPALTGAVQQAATRRGLRLLWQPPADEAPGDEALRTTWLAGGLAASLGVLDAGPPTVDKATWERGGAAVTDSFAPPVMTPGPRRAADELGEPHRAWQEALRHFHVTGEGALSSADAVPGLPLRPWAMPDMTASGWPLVVADEGPQPFGEMAADLASGSDLLRAHLRRLVEAVRLAAGSGAPRPLAEVVAAAREGFVARLDLSPAAARTMEADYDAFVQALPAEQAVGFGPRSLLHLLALAAERAGRSRGQAFRRELDGLIRRLEERLAVDSGQGEAQDEHLAAAFGGALQLDVTRLAPKLATRRGSVPLGEERRQRMMATLQRLRRFRDEASRLPDVVLLHAPGVEVTDLPDGVTAVEHDNGMEAATGTFEASAQHMVDLFRAVRAARLDVEDAYRDEHGAALERLDWQGLQASELALVPPVFVVETARRVLGTSLSSLSTLLRCGRPLHLIILDASPTFPQASARDGLAAAHADVGHLAMAHRDALVLQTTLAEPAPLFHGLGQVAGSLRPSVAVVAVPDWRSPTSPLVQLAAGRDGRATPCFIYDPDGGGSWADRFELTSNPEPDRAWPRRPVRVVEANGETLEQEELFTFAHAAALAPVCRREFRVIPAAAHTDEQLPITDYLALSPAERMQRIPYIEVVRNDGCLARAVMTRAMARACADSLQEWRSLQELGGRRNEYARRAAAAERERAEQESQTLQDEQQRDHDEERVALRREATQQALERLARALLSVDGEGVPAVLSGIAAPAPTAAGQASAAGAAPQTAEGAAGEAPVEKTTVEETGESDFVEEGYIDSPLCTSCHDCINMNPRMFQYDANKQATLADPSAGTYAELVKAAEACPARCIHPGLPQPGDSTATAQLVERARRIG